LFLGGGSVVSIFVFSIALLWIGGGPYVAACIINRTSRPALWLPVAAVVIACISLLMLSLSVTQESLDDICGASDFYRRAVQASYYGASVQHLLMPLPGTLISLIERTVRYVGLYGHVSVVMTALFTWHIGRAAEKPMFSTFILLCVFTPLCLWLCKIIVFDWAITDNLTELIAQDGLIFVYLLLGILASNAAYLATGKWNRSRVATTALLTAAALPATWWLLNRGLESVLVKYGSVFSAVQFLLGPDRQHTLSMGTLFTRWSALYLGGVIVIALGARLMRFALVHCGEPAESGKQLDVHSCRIAPLANHSSV
jgi:hypothetical protein